MIYEPTWKENLFFMFMGLLLGISIGIWLWSYYKCDTIDTARFVTVQKVKPLYIATESDRGVLYNAKHSINDTYTVSEDSVLITVSSYINDKSVYTNTLMPVCPYCGSKEFTKYYSRNTIVNKIVPHLLNMGGKVDNVVSDLNRCNECGKEFTVDKHKLTRTEDGVLFTSDKWLYTTMIHRHE